MRSLTVFIAQTVPAPWLGEGALAGLSTFLIASFLNEWIVSGKMYRAAKTEGTELLAAERARHAEEIKELKATRDKWQQVALEALGHAEHVVKITEGRS